MKNPDNTLGKTIAGVDNAVDFLEEEVTGLFPILDGKILDVNVAQEVFGGAISVDHLDGQFIVLADWGRASLRREAELGEDGMKVFCNFSGRGGSKEFCFSGVGSGD
jgi:hypothetical protein